MNRSQIREQIFKLLFRVEFNSQEDMPEQVKLFMESPTLDKDEDNCKEISISDNEQQYIINKYEDVVSHMSEIDGIINDNAKGWSTDRLGKVELTILRLAVYEIKYDNDIPVSVAIDQAVELSKRFGRDESYSFINGILASVAK